MRKLLGLFLALALACAPAFAQRISGGGTTTLPFATANCGIFGVTNIFCWNATGLTLDASTSVGWSSTTVPSTADAEIRRDNANVIAIRRGTNPQTLNIYNTFTDTSNYERGVMTWIGNELVVGMQAAGTGVARVLRLGRDASDVRIGNTGVPNQWLFDSNNTTRLYPGADNSSDIGDAAHRVKDLYLSNTIKYGNGAVAGGGIPVLSVCKSGAATSAPADTTEDTLATCSITGNFLSANGRIEIRTLWTVTNNANAKTARVRLGGTLISSAFNLASTNAGSITVQTMNRNATNSQISNTVTSTSALALTDQNITTTAVDTTSSQNITITCQKATAGDTCTLEAYAILVIP